jgi:predicted dehydrogenase
LPVVAQMVKNGALGRLLEIRARGKEDDRGGVQDLWVLGTHVLNLAHFLAGNPQACSATLLQDARPVTRADVHEGAEGIGPVAGNELHARFEMMSGVPVFFDSIRKAGNSAGGFGLQLIGTEGIVDLRTDREPFAHLSPGNPFAPSKEPRPWIPISTAGPGKPEPVTDLAVAVSSHLVAVRDLIAAIRGDRQPLCSAMDARVTIEMVMATFESHRQGGRRVTWPLPERGNPLLAL